MAFDCSRMNPTLAKIVAAYAARGMSPDKILAEIQKSIPEMDMKSIEGAIEYLAVKHGRTVEGRKQQKKSIEKSARKAGIDKSLQKVVDSIPDRVNDKKSRVKAARAITGMKNAIKKVELAGDAEKLARKYMKQFIDSFIRDVHEMGMTRDELVDAVHSVVEEANIDAGFPWTRQDTSNAIAGYGDFKPLTKDPKELELKQRKAELLQVAKLDDMLHGNPPKATGVERAAPSTEQRLLTKQVNELKKKLGFDKVEGDKLKTAIQTARTRLENQIKDMQREMDEGKQAVRTRTPPPTTPELEALRAERDALKKKYDEFFRMDDVKAAEKMKAVEQQIKELEAKIAAKDTSTKGEPKPIGPKQEMVAKRDALQKELQVMRNAEKAKARVAEIEAKIAEGDIATKGRPQGPKTEVQAKRDAAQKELNKLRARANTVVRLNETIADLEWQVEAIHNADSAEQARILQAVEDKKQKQDEEIDREIERLEFEKALLVNEVNSKIEDLKPFSMAQVLTSPNGIFKTAMTTMDISYPGRQGIMSLLSWNVGPLAKAIAKAMDPKAGAWTEQRLAKETREVMDDPMTPLAAKRGLEFTQHIEEMEARILRTKAGKIARNISGAALADRLFVAMGNRLRLELFKTFYTSLGENVTEAEGKAIANLVNDMTLRARISPGIAQFLNNIVFSARAVAARLRMIVGIPIWTAPSRRVRWLAIWQYLKIATSGLALFTVAHFMGMLGSKDPRDTDFLKLKDGETRVDVLAGVGGMFVDVIRFFANERVRNGEVIEDRDASKALRKKLSPLAGLLWDWKSGEDFNRMPFDLRRAIITRLIPLSVQEATDNYASDGFTPATVRTLLAFVGLGVQNYDNKNAVLADSIIRALGGTPSQKQPKPKPFKAKPIVR